MLIFDIETLGKTTESVVLSMACIRIDLDHKPTYSQMIESAFFVKLNVEDQVKRLKRTISKQTIDWWAKQCDLAKNKSLKPSPNDVTAEEAINLFREWANKQDINKNEWVFARGNLDQLIIDALTESIHQEQVFHFNRWRDVRTAIDFLTGSTNGYCTVPNFDPKAHVIKHDPVHDCAYDGMMLLYGEKHVSTMP